MLSLLTNRKEFIDPWVGHAGWNAGGLHPRRMRLAAACAAVRRAQSAWGGGEMAASLRRDGIAVVENFLPPDAFERLREEARRACEAAQAAAPIAHAAPGAGSFGFGAKRDHAWGFDRNDGTTVNRFIAIDRATMPACWALARDPRLANGSRHVTGARHPARHVRIYQTCHGDEAKSRDVQKLLHRDTFFSSMKFWYFIDCVRDEDGPFVYVPGSHRLTPERLSWEQSRALKACRAARLPGGQVTFDDNMALGGSFRIGDDELPALGLPAPQAYPVPANTLVMADTLGFHRRGDASPGARRLAIYGNKRPLLPFGLLGT